MRYFFLLLFITFLCTCPGSTVDAQLAVTVSPGLLANRCTGAQPAPNDDRNAGAKGTELSTYRIGSDGDLLCTYRIINKSGKIIRRVEVTDSYFGDFFPEQKVNIPSGTTVPLHIIHKALTKPETIDGRVHLWVQYADGSSEEVSSNYSLEAVGSAHTDSHTVFTAATSQPAVYPNPAADRITLQNFAGGSVSVIDAQGKTVLRTYLSASGSMDVSSLRFGVYLLRVNGMSIRWVKR